jgi:tetratricopeptide (TPR) repeat protein
MRHAAVGVALLASVAIGHAQAPDPSTYRAAVDAYVKSGDIMRAVGPLQSWSSAEFAAATKAVIAGKNAAELRAAAVFHLEIGVALVGISPGAAAGHFRFGSDLLDHWTAAQPLVKPGAGEAEKIFRAMWFGVAGSAFLAVKDIFRATPFVNKASDIQPRSARARMLAGMIDEFAASLYNPGGAPTLARRGRSQREQAIRLSQAEKDYRQALLLDGNYAPALIRLGRVLHLLNQLKDARAMLERGQTVASDAGTRYVAALFMGALQQAEKDLDGARRSYEQALAIAPTSQPAAVALAHLELMAGRPDRASAVARNLAEASAAGQPWFASHYGGLDLAGLEWLRAQVRQ